MHLALYHPQIPQNTGTLMRLSSCLGLHIDLIRPFGFVLDDKKLRRAGMDYIATTDYEVHDSFDIFAKKYDGKRLIALDGSAENRSFYEFQYKNDDILIVGSEHYGFLEEDKDKFFDFVKIPMVPNRRSLNMAISAAIVLGEAMARLKLFK